MKKQVLLALSILFCLFSCENRITKPDFVNEACGCEDPTENIQWLKELVEKAETDSTGNYWGTIYLDEYMGNDIFFIMMPMGSGGVIGYWYNCDGTSFVPEDSSYHMNLDKYIYSNYYK